MPRFSKKKVEVIAKWLYENFCQTNHIPWSERGERYYNVCDVLFVYGKDYWRKKAVELLVLEARK
jgi:hypothetical protein